MNESQPHRLGTDESGRELYAHVTTVTVPANPDEDDCLTAAAQAYIADHSDLAGYDLEARWTDDDNRETVTLTVPAWHLDQLTA